MTQNDKQMLILGGGLTGLSAGCMLSRAGFPVTVFEGDSAVGGISKTIEQKGFRFDLGGHRFFTTDARLDAFVRDLMGDELIMVPRTSKIFIGGKYFDYPLKPLNAVFGMGIPATIRILSDYSKERIRGLLHQPKPVSLEDWVVANFGRTMFNIYFKVYSEKVWGIESHRISAEWVSQRIKGLSLSKAITNAFFRLNRKKIATLADEFLYPRLGIGRIAERLAEEIKKSGTVFTDTRVEALNHSGNRIESVTVKDRDTIKGAEFVSSIPVTKLISMLSPTPPDDVMAAAAKLKFRDIMIIAVMVNSERVTDQTWIYLPEQNIPIARIHEPTNWSIEMAPPGKTLIVAEFFCFRGDEMWRKSDDELARLTIDNLEQLGYIKQNEVLGSVVKRVPKAYPLFEVGFERYFTICADYLAGFTNLHIAGRSGKFKYYNMDHAIASGMEAAETIIQRYAPHEAMPL